jgi:demethylmenaquinone methyltransferase/2-methoxy-6-polyprenyl-1,4-benzoquinol methylase
MTTQAKTTHTGSSWNPSNAATMTKNGSIRIGMPNRRKWALVTVRSVRRRDGDGGTDRRTGAPTMPGMAVPETLPEGDEKVRAVRGMFDAIAPRYDLVNRLMTFRMDVGWRRRTVRALDLAAGSRVLDLACGTGDLCRELRSAGVRPVGFDLSFGMLSAATTSAPLAQADALRMPVAGGRVDGVTCGFALRNFVALAPFLDELARVVRPGGRIGLLEVAEPRNPVLRWGHGIYFGRIVPLIGGLLSDPAAYRYLPRSVAYLPEPERLRGMVAEAGFVDVERALLSTGIAQLITATRGS